MGMPFMRTNWNVRYYFGTEQPGKRCLCPDDGGRGKPNPHFTTCAQEVTTNASQLFFQIELETL